MHYHQFMTRSQSSSSSFASVPVLFIWIIYLSCLLNTTAYGVKWPTHEQELADEINDAKLLSSVQRSMVEWQKSHKNHRKKRADKSVCYGELGCFEDSGPFGYLDMLPSSPEEINTKFMFYSTKNRSDKPLVELPYLNMTDAWSVFTNAESAVNQTAINKVWQGLKNFEGLDVLSVRVIVHGFGSSCPHVWIYEMRTALMAVEDCIVICVDWENGANLPNYVRAAANTRLIGKQLAMFLKGLQEFKRLNLSKVHIIGFSLGAHVSGFAGAELPGISRITGLDPAGPLFESQHPKARLDSTDASFVDVIHSNGENLILGGLGSWQPMGDVDFYPNGGRVQHGCSNLFVGAVTDFIWSPTATVEGRSLCNHRRAYKFFIDSVAPRCLFPAFPCDSYDDFLKGHCFPCDKKQQENPETAAKCGNMGYYADRSTGRGQLYLVTREEEPFCAHQFNIEIFSSQSDLPLRTLGRLEAILEGDGSLNETFSITEKDDTEFLAGDVISRILVPHPALGFPHSISLTYKSYSGWLSKGLPHWTIHKIVMTDSFGTKMSLCKRHMSLYSEKSVYMKLLPGDCYIPEENDVTSGPTSSSEKSAVGEDEATTKNDINKIQEYKHSTTSPYDDDVDRLREKKEIINLGSNFKITANSTFAFVEQPNQLPWQPVLENGNALDRDAEKHKQQATDKSYDKETIEESGRSISFEPRIPMRFPDVDEIIEPILKSTTQKNRKMKNVQVDDGNTNEVVKPRDNSFFTIQLLPFRLGELIERAERYARETLLPLISEQAPRFFGFGGAGTGGSPEIRSDRTPKYFPSLGEMMANAGDTDIQESRVSERRINLPPAFSTGLTIEQTELDDGIVRVDADDEIVSTVDQPTVSNSTTEISKNSTAEETAAAAAATTGDDVSAVDESRSNKNILGLLRSNSKQPKTMTDEQVISRRSYYTSVADEPALHSDIDLRVIRIGLPTFRPTVASPTQFPYKYDRQMPIIATTENLLNRIQRRLGFAWNE